MSLEEIFRDLGGFLQKDHPKKQPSTYLDLKNGKVPLRIGTNYNPHPHQQLPSLILSHPGQKFGNIISESIPIQCKIQDILQINWPYQNQEDKDAIDSVICDDIVQQSVRNTSLKLFSNQNGQIPMIKQELSEIVHTGTVDVQTFSNNSITNITQYDLQGNPIKIQNYMINPQSKNYIEIQREQLIIYNNLPHPVRNKKKKIQQKILGVQKKSVKQIMDQFQILNSMFDSKSMLSGQQSKLDTENANKILDAVNLVDYSYQDLWEKIVGDIKITNKDTDKIKIKKTQISQQMRDEQFDQAIDRIIEEAVQYQKEAFDADDEEQEDDEQNSEQDKDKIQTAQKKTQKVVVPEKMEKNVDSFSNAKIQKKTAITISSRYQFAVEDERDLTNFYDILPKQKFAVQYQFQLDQFQKRSVLHLENKESIFVAAHTSAGKTAVAEYGIGLAINHKRKVIYTSPIKALSNQKYRQLSKKFGSDNVGIITGDVSMNQQANCVIMTTQILRNNLYRGAEMIRDIQWVIFDEVHYINNQDRGVVWEETIILLPEHIGIIMLSATVPNYMDFANWVGRTKHRIIYVMKTLHRPVPLEHSLYIFNKFHVIKQANGRFLKEEYKQLGTQIKSMSRNQEDLNKALKQNKKKKIEEKGFYNDTRRQANKKLITKNAKDKFIKKISRADLETAEGREEHRVLQELIFDCNKKKLLPCVVFTFSKKKINSLAEKLYLYDLTTRPEKSKINRLITSALSNLKPEDQQIQQFQFLYSICMNGYAVHHGDLLPIAKQIVEILFSKGLIKVLFATETFAMGINMPTKTVIFNSIRKVKDSSGLQRFLNSSEYVQMSGRAGRRGLDEKGTVIIIVKDPSSLPQVNEMEVMVDHPGEMLNSKFKVTYQIILNLLNSADLGVTEMLRQSFLENPKFSEFTSNVKSVKHYMNEYKELSEFQCPFNKLGTKILMQEYMNIAGDLRTQNYKSLRTLMEGKGLKNYPKYAKILGHNNQTQIGLILKIDTSQGKNTQKGRSVQVMLANKILIDHQVDKVDRQKMQKQAGIKKRIVLQYDEDSQAKNKIYKGDIPNTRKQYQYTVHWIEATMIIEVYMEKINTKYAIEDRSDLFEQLSEFLLKTPSKLTPFQNNAQKIEKLVMFQTSHCHTCEMKEKHSHQYQRRLEVKDRISNCAKKIDTNQLGLMGSFEGMLLVLSYFKFIRESQKENGEIAHTLTLKGRVAKQVDIYVAQVIVEAILDPLDPPEIAALLSAFVCDYKPRPSRNQSDDVITSIPKNTNFTTGLASGIGKTMKIIHQITQQQEQMSAFINLNASCMEQHVLSIANFHLADTVYKWAIGFDFSEAMQDTKAPEGTIVRTIMRLSQLLSNIKSVCRILGNSQLEIKVDIALESIKRDIVFCQSLYLTN